MFVTVCITLPGWDMYCSSGHDRWLHVPASCPLPTWHCWLPPEQYDARIRSQYIEPKMQGNLARYISHIASLLMLAFYVLHFGMRMRTRIYHLRFGGDTVRAKCWLILMWFIWFSPMFQHFVVISRMSCWSVFSKRDLLFLINLLIQSVYLYSNAVFACFGAFLSASTQTCSRLPGSPRPFHPEMGMCQDVLFHPSPVVSIYPALWLVENHDTGVMYAYAFNCKYKVYD